MAGLSRAELVRRGGRGGAAVLLAGPALSLAPEARAGTPSDNDPSTGAVGARLESLFLGAYLGAVAGFDAGELKTLAARIAASEAQHLGVLAGEAGGENVGAAFPRPLTIDRASDELDEFTA
jgi:hypothetical protein